MRSPLHSTSEFGGMMRYVISIYPPLGCVTLTSLSVPKNVYAESATA